MEPFDIWAGRNPDSNEVDFIQLMIVGEVAVDLGGCLTFEPATDDQRQRLAATFRAAAEILTAPVPKPPSNVLKMHRFFDGSVGHIPDDG